MSADADPLQCSYCEARYKHVRSKYRHEKTAHADRLAIKCPYCAALFATAKDRQNHVNSIHSANNLYSRKHCPSSFSKAGSLRWHRYRQHSNRGGSSAKNSPTSLTDKSIPVVALVPVKKPLKHLRTKNGVQILYANEFTCFYCPAFLSNVRSKERHERQHIGKTSLVCESCSVSFYHLYAYEKHRLVCSSLHSASWCRYCDFYTFERSYVEHHYRRVHGFRFQSEMEVEFLRREVGGSGKTDGDQSDPKASVECERTEASDDGGVSESSIQVDSQIVDMELESESNQRTEMIVHQNDATVPDPNASPECEETVASGSMEQCDGSRSPPTAELRDQKMELESESNQRSETVVVQQHDGPEPGPNLSSEYEGTEASNNAEVSHCKDQNIKPELESESHQRTELVVQQENIPIEDTNIVKYEIEGAQIDENSEDIFKTPSYRTSDLTKGNDDELLSRVIVIDVDDDSN